MRVLQVMAGAPQGGAETAFEDISLALSEAGIQQKIVIRGNNPERVKAFRDAGIDVVTLPFGGRFDFVTSWKIKKIIAAYKPHIVQTWMSRATQKTPSSKHPKTYLKVARLGGYYGLKYFKGTDYFIANIPDIQNYLIKEGVPENSTTTLYNFAKVETIEKHVSKADFNTPEDAPVILSLARYHSAKALDVLIRAVVDIPDVHVWLAGEGPEEASLKQLAHNLGVVERIHFLGWRRDKAALMKAADLCVFPSRFEPFGNVVIQAWAHKIPLICSMAEGPKQYVHDGENALMFPVDDVGACTVQIQKLLQDKSLAQHLVDAGYAEYQQKFSKEKVVEDYIRFYEDILAREGIAI